MGCVEGSKIVVSEAVCMDVYCTGCLSAGKCDSVFLRQLRCARHVFNGYYFYSWVKAYKEGWNWTTCAVSAIGMGLCFLSYYNAYGFILTTFFFFVGTMLTDQEKAPKERWKEMIQKGLFILVIVCVIALWWFIRNAILYHGDFLGRETSSACAELYARAKYKPSNSKTFQKKATPCYV